MSKVLWILECDNGMGNELLPLYATSREDAERLADERIAHERQRRKFANILRPLSLKAWPEGFMLQHGRLPGIIFP